LQELARSVPAMDISGEKASRNRCDGRQKGDFPAAESFAIASLEQEWYELGYG